MFLFLSKLLPLLIYPLGLSCGLIVVALVLLWRRRTRWAMGAIATALAVLLMGSNAWVATRLTQTLEWQNLPPQPVPKAEAIVVLGGSTRSAIYPRPWVDLNEAGDRILHGIRLYQGGKAPLLVFSGGRIAWRGGGDPESADMAKIATAWGVPAQAIAQDTTSLNTHQNAVNVKALLDERGLNRILLVTSAMHMPRALAIFRHQGMEVIAAPTDFLVSVQTVEEISGSRQGVMLSLLPDASNLFQVSRALKEYLGLLVYRLKGWL
ncbi:MAG: YdcF family protein [Cyanobacteria bacterium]|nr:YdcF family protein [Cyanobacteriota bacterium]MDA0865925.1 YdcF family protein [Cyanobacteriota bacterium]